MGKNDISEVQAKTDKILVIANRLRVMEKIDQETKNQLAEIARLSCQTLNLATSAKHKKARTGAI